MQKNLNSTELGEAISRWMGEIVGSLDAGEPVMVVGIRTRGETLAKRIAEFLRARGFKDVREGVLDITLYRDDLSEIGPRAVVRPTHIDAVIDGIPVIIVDDVLFTGRSARAALNVLSDFGRPRVVRLAVLVDRGGRELPIQPDFVGLRWEDLPLKAHVRVKLNENDGEEGIVTSMRT